MVSWVCADCSTEYDEDVNFCTDCGSDRIANLDDSPAVQTTRADLEWRCTECKHRHMKNSPPCTKCGNMQLEAVDAQTSDAEPAPQPDEDSLKESSRSITLRLLAAYGFGVLAILNFTAALVFVTIGPLVLHTAAVYAAFPPARRLLRRRWGVTISTPAAVVIYLVATLAGNLWFIAQT